MFHRACRCVGYLFQKVGKVAATSVGGGLLLLQVRRHHWACMCRKYVVVLVVCISKALQRSDRAFGWGCNPLLAADREPYRLHPGGLEEG